MERSRFLHHKQKGSVAVLMAVLLPAVALSMASIVEAARYLFSESRGSAAVKSTVQSIMGCYDWDLYQAYGVYGIIGDEEVLSAQAKNYLGSNPKPSEITVELDSYALTQTRWMKENMMFRGKQDLGGKSAKTVLFPEDACVHVKDEGETHPLRSLQNKRAAERLPSHQQPQGGLLQNMDWNGTLMDLEELVEKGGERTLLAVYLQTHFGTLESPKPNTFFSGELEYIVSGAESDEENKRKTNAYLIALRTALNALYLETNPVKQEEAIALAALLTGPAAPWTEQAILAAWAVAEAACDLRHLREGERVPLYKTDWTWSLSADGLKRYLLSGLESTGETEAITEGLSYDEYLTLLLFFEREETIILRAMDIMQLNMQANWNSAFSFDRCFAGIGLTVSWHDTTASLLPQLLRTHTAQWQDAFW